MPWLSICQSGEAAVAASISSNLAPFLPSVVHSHNLAFGVPGSVASRCVTAFVAAIVAPVPINIRYLVPTHVALVVITTVCECDQGDVGMGADKGGKWGG